MGNPESKIRCHNCVRSFDLVALILRPTRACFPSRRGRIQKEYRGKNCDCTVRANIVSHRDAYKAWDKYYEAGGGQGENDSEDEDTELRRLGNENGDAQECDEECHSKEKSEDSFDPRPMR